MFKKLHIKIFQSAFRKLKRALYQEILVLGDSHAAVFEENNFRYAFPDIIFNVVSVGGATVSGLENPNSKTQALPIFRRAIAKSKAKIVIVLLGEVDTGFVIWYRAEKYNASVFNMLDNALTNYKKLLQELANERQVICLSTPLPTIKDGDTMGEVANARKEIKATQLQRTQLTLEFNDKMRNFCESKGIIYLSYDDESINADGIVAEYLLNDNSADHHYNNHVYAEMIIKKLKEFI